MRLNNKKFITSLVLLLILSIGVGYAYLTRNLSISGSTLIAANSWDIHFDNLVINPDSVEATTPASIDISDTTSITYAVVLSRPGDFYEFTVDMVNTGSLPGKISLVTINGITAAAEDLVDYTITYSNGKPVAVNNILNGNSSKNIKVRVFYNDDIDSSDLPSSNIPLTLTLNINYVQSEKDEPRASTLLKDLAVNNSCITKYTGDVTDSVGVTTTASNVYINKCEDKRNIIFGGYCWQTIRTTENGGMKLIYNGEPVNGKCESTRSDHIGIVATEGEYSHLDTSYLYGSNYTYDASTGVFTLVDTTTTTWSDSTYENLLGKYTCKSNSSTCSTMYVIASYYSNEIGYIIPYTVSNTAYSDIGAVPFNSNFSLAYVGYMFNKVYAFSYMGPGTGDYVYGSGFSYSGGTYTLTGTHSYSDWSLAYNNINNLHYTCWNSTGVCTTLSFIYNTDSSTAYYMQLSGGKDVDDLMDEMLDDEDVNIHDSVVKGLIDKWYKDNLLSYNSYLEDTVYCNDRTVTNLGGWSTSGDLSSTLLFKNNSLTTNLSCSRQLDQFAVSNNKAKLTYPVALITQEELYNLAPTEDSSPLRRTDTKYWSLSPDSYVSYYTSTRYVSNSGSMTFSSTHYPLSIRPVITIKNITTISSGTGTETDPWIVE